MAEIGYQGGERMWPSEETASWLYGLANAGLIIGLVLGVISTMMIVWMGNVKEEYLKRVLSDSRERTAQAEQQAAEAKLELEKFKAPRTLSAEDQQLIISELSKFAGQEYMITTFWDLAEPMGFSNQLHKTLQMAGWKYIPHGEHGSWLLGGLAGVQIWFHPDANTPVKDAANALESVLKALGQAPTLRTQNSKTVNDNRIHLNIGTKP